MKKTLMALWLAAALPGTAAHASPPATASVQPDATAIQPALSDSQIIAKLTRNSYAFWQQIRNDNGTYNDGHHLGKASHRGSIANAGMGLIALTVGHQMGYEPGAEQLAEKTLTMLAGHDPDFSVPRNARGTYIHFYNTQTGETIGDDWSPIDSAIMISGALFAKRYWPENAKIAAMADEIFQSTDLTSFIADVKRGEIHLAAYPDGSFKPNKTKAFNEYMIVASVARAQAEAQGLGPDSAPQRFWDKWYATTENVPKPTYKGIEVLGVNKNWFVSKFNYLFNNYLVNEFSAEPVYQQAITNAAKADFTWWQDRDWGQRSYEWGSGAGACQRGYCVDRMTLPDQKGKNDFQIVSPHILSGFMPYSDRARADLLAIYRDERQLAHYQLDNGETVLWRYSHQDHDWRANAIQAVDYSTMLFGLAALDENLGMAFFNAHNDYYNPQQPQYSRN
ncbi:hypothetical protein [Ferrimonas pelagia]|uniref:Glycoamylase-like domain-containing protein n=1 Tax=Ferrimonas pelagia TaxID=1177826 RepID=A0ABP9EJ93_9GAMM